MRHRLGPRMRTRVGLAALAIGVLLAGCGADDAPDVLLVPDDAAEVVAATTLDPDDAPACGEGLAWDDPPVTLHVVDTPWARTVTVQGVREDVGQVVVCDHAPGADEDGTPVVTDPLANTGTSRAVGNDYVAQVGIILGRVDVGIPEGAVTATYVVGDTTVTYDVDGLTTLRLHALDDDPGEDGFTMGTVTFLDADGTDLTPAVTELPDVIHGVPRDRDNGAEVERED